MRILLGGLLTSLVLWALPVHGQVSDAQIVALVEALRLAAPTTTTEEDGLYSPWKIKPSNIPRWSRLCIGEELTPEQFVADLTKARHILVCVMEDVLRREYPLSDNDEALAVRRAAAWWVAGDPSLYNAGEIALYTRKVLDLYQNLRAYPGDFVPNREANK
ncbi:hypothetical protein [Phormidium sp. CCY1219]|uniref:hypothetical protein n=1 Tax=Phormidium sp. CCY1219 TaxID=2886104 RepID=UPI002D1F3ABB|nr:hypothetical protein [Phormidium sp. CCY1219]MEB3827118.1 hypothetical protein [Phormidium sp. CCY1219]